MGGSGGGGWTVSTPRNPCDTLAFQASLNSPNPAIVPSINIGDVLVVTLAPPPQQSVWVYKGANVVGSLTGPQVAGLIRCIHNGYVFEAEVLAVNGGNCRLEVRPQ